MTAHRVTKEQVPTMVEIIMEACNKLLHVHGCSNLWYLQGVQGWGRCTGTRWTRYGVTPGTRAAGNVDGGR